MARFRLESSAIGISAAVFLSGAVLLGLELVASRVLAPFFGNSIFVWGALIGVVLAGLSIGYWVGGVLADRYPAPQLLLGVLALGGGMTLLIPVVDDRVLEAVVEWDLGPRWNPLVAAVILFGLPSVILATATPIAVRLRARSLTSLGKTAGRLFAISTAGSIAGTFATAFFLIPEVGTNQLLGMLATGLFVAAGLVALSERMLLTGAAVAALVAASVAATVSLAPDEGGRLTGAAAQNWSPLFRERGERQEVVPRRRGLRARVLEEHPLPRPVRGGRRRGEAPAFRQLLSERHVPRQPVSHQIPVHRLPAAPARLQLRARGRSCSSGSEAGRSRSGCGATSPASTSRSSSSTRSCATWRIATSSCRGAPACA